MRELLLALEILLISAILSVDNALVIGMATRHLQKDTRQKAIFWGTMGAVGLRILLSLVAVILINTPFLKLIGGLFLLFIAYRMLGDHQEAQHMRRSQELLKAIQIIVIADLMVSLDNVIAIVGISHGNWYLLFLGILASIPCILYGSQFISSMIRRYPIVLYAGVAVLSWTGASMILEEHLVAQWIATLAIPHLAFNLIAVLATALASLFSRRLT